MNWFDWALLSWLTFGTVCTIALIGKPRGPITPGVAVITLLINSALALGAVMTR